MDLFVYLCLFLLFLCFLQYALYYTPKSLAFNKIPGPERLPIVGNIFYFLHSPVALFSLTRHLANTYKRIYSVQVCNSKVINIFNPQDLEIILSSSKYITKSNLYNFLHPWLNEGLLTSKGEKWHRRRKILTPAFHFNILKQFCKTFDEQSQNLVDHIKSMKSGNVSIIPEITQFAINSICETAMGTQMKTNGYESKFDLYKNAVYEIGSYIVIRLIRIWVHSDALFKLTSWYKGQQRSLAILHDFTTTVIRQRRKERESGNGVEIIHNEDIENEEYFKSNKKRLAMLDLLLSAEAEGKIDEAGIREEVDTFMFEGHDTTAMAICFSLMLLANHKEDQDKIVQELNEIFLDPKRSATIEDLNSMKYLELCIKESLRLYPSVHFISRMLEEDVQLTDYLVPSGADCHIHIYDLHRDSTIYPRPHDFIPERFTLENSSKRHPFAYVPFSAGPRNCIGQKFAMYELKSVISNVLRNFVLEHITRPDDIVMTSDLILRSRDPIYIKFIPRQ